MNTYEVTIYSQGTKHFVSCSAKDEKAAKAKAREMFLGRTKIVKVERKS